MEIVNPYSKGSWRNHPAPRLPQWMQDELRNIGGVVPYGEYRHHPQLIFEWGQEATAFRCGEMRLKYVDSRIPAIEHPRRCLWRTTAEFDHFDRETGTPVYKREIQPIDGEPPQIIPDGWFYQEDLPRLEFVGQQMFYIAQWKMPEMLGSPEAWEDARFDWWENPETGETEWTDMTGPFPRGGRYEPIHVIAKKLIALCHKPNPFLDDQLELVEKEVLTYAEPTRQHIEEIRAAWQRREREKFLTPMDLSRQAFARDREIRRDRRTQNADTRRAVARDLSESQKPKVYQQNANLENMPTRFGKGRKINVNTIAGGK